MQVIIVVCISGGSAYSNAVNAVPVRGPVSWESVNPSTGHQASSTGHQTSSTGHQTTSTGHQATSNTDSSYTTRR